jgi:hypothetical protein
LAAAGFDRFLSLKLWAHGFPSRRVTGDVGGGLAGFEDGFRLGTLPGVQVTSRVVRVSTQARTARTGQDVGRLTTILVFNSVMCKR